MGMAKEKLFSGKRRGSCRGCHGHRVIISNMVRRPSKACVPGAGPVVFGRAGVGACFCKIDSGFVRSNSCVQLDCLSFTCGFAPFLGGSLVGKLGLAIANGGLFLLAGCSKSSPRVDKGSSTSKANSFKVSGCTIPDAHDFGFALGTAFWGLVVVVGVMGCVVKALLLYNDLANYRSVLSSGVGPSGSGGMAPRRTLPMMVFCTSRTGCSRTRCKTCLSVTLAAKKGDRAGACTCGNN